MTLLNSSGSTFFHCKQTQGFTGSRTYFFLDTTINRANLFSQQGKQIKTNHHFSRRLLAARKEAINQYQHLGGMKFSTHTTSTLITLFLLLATITTALPLKVPSSSLSTTSSSTALLGQGNILQGELKRGHYIVKRASTGEVIGIVIGSLAGVILVGLVCYISAMRT